MTYVSNITELGLYLFTKSWTHHFHLYIKLLYFTDMIDSCGGRRGMVSTLRLPTNHKDPHEILELV